VLMASLRLCVSALPLGGSINAEAPRRQDAKAQGDAQTILIRVMSSLRRYSQSGVQVRNAPNKTLQRMPGERSGCRARCPRPGTAEFSRSAARAHRKDTRMRNEQAAPETKGVTVKLLAALDLGPEIEGMAGRQLRMRIVTIDPGGVFGPIHDHKDRPGMVYILQGTITDHRNGVAKDYGPGVGWPEDRDTTHWLENRGTTPAVEISVDIARIS
jgi:quercetin dioxygenase-like cupin family protein